MRDVLIRPLPVMLTTLCLILTSFHSSATGQITEMSILDRSVIGLLLLLHGVTEMGNTTFFCGGAGTGCTNINFSSNGQRNSSADVMLDGAIITSLEGAA